MDVKAGMFFYALAFLLGVLTVQQLPVLPSVFTLLILSGLVCLCLVLIVLSVKKQYVFMKYVTLTVVFNLLIIMGFIYASFYAIQQLSTRFSETLVGQNIIISGQVVSVPVTDGYVQRFEFNVESFRLLRAEGESVAQVFPEKIRLSWYYGRPVSAAERWQFEVRLKPPHGFMNPGGFDYEKWLFQQGIDATGYVRKSSLNKREKISSGSIDTIRQLLSNKIDMLRSKLNADETSSFSLIKALAVGDKSSISSQQWRVLTRTGTSHLMAISGLHIGLASLFAYVLIRRIIPVSVMARVPAQHLALTGGMLCALLYALIAGLSIPTQRAIIMLFVLSVMLLIRRNHRPVDALGFALLLVIVVDPLAVLSAGFWFSFSAVAVIFISITNPQKPGEKSHSVGHRILSILQQWVRLQLLISVFLLPLSLFMFQQVSLVSPLANLLLIPYVSFLVVPVVLLAIIFFFLSPYVSDVLFSLAATLLDFIWPLLSAVSSLPYALWVRGDIGVFKLIAITLAMLMLFYASNLSRYLSEHSEMFATRYTVWLLRLVSLVFFLPLVFTGKTQLEAGQYQVTVLDVGQGSAAVIQTKNHLVVFDSGAKFSDRLNAGSGVVIPYLRAQGIKQLDRLVISHGDSDHIGGARAILDEYPGVLLLGQDIEQLPPTNGQICSAGLQWRWDGVDFIFLSPEPGTSSSDRVIKRNNRSCVLQLVSDSGRVLFTGDIEKKVEKKLLKKYGQQLASDVLLVPHHGSNTSSSAAFLQTVNPAIALISAGYKNRYRLPNRKVLSRYEAQGRAIYRTDRAGAITIKLTAENGIKLQRYREQAARYWHHNSL